MRSTSRNTICKKQPFGGGRRAVFLCAGMGSFAPPGASSFLSSLKESYQRKPLETTFQDFLGAGTSRCEFDSVYSRAGCSGHHCRSKGLCLRSPARRLARPLAPATVGVFASTGLGEFRRPGGEQVLRLRAQAAFFLCRKKAAKERHLRKGGFRISPFP